MTRGWQRSGGQTVLHRQGAIRLWVFVFLGLLVLPSPVARL